MKLVLILGVIFGGLGANASESECVLEYRKSYIEFARTNDPAYSDAAELYSMYFDYSNGLSGGANAEQRQSLELLKAGMDDGSLCTFFGYTRPKGDVESRLAVAPQNK